MNIDRLNKIEEIYHAVLQSPVGERGAVIDKRCGDDADLRREVESLLAFEKVPENFLDTPPDALAADMFSGTENEADLTGKEIDHYKIINLLGSGGMGEVYLAEDTKLRRKVALKLLPPQFSADGERKTRFEKEALSVSSLNHPNIITIYEIGESGNMSFMATEFIDGHTLRQRIADKPLSWRESVKIAIQIAGALDSAHAVGIIHRDIKPANIMIRQDGIVKVLDFGLAKLSGPDPINVETRDQTAEHRVMGTINYMSPEQALGERIDTRTDIFSFGVVLYEMLTGEVPFAGPSDAAIYNATIHKTLPSVCESDGEIPLALDHVVKRALEKDRQSRYQNIADVRSDLTGLLRTVATDPFAYSYTDQTVQKTDPNQDARETGSNEAEDSSGLSVEQDVFNDRPYDSASAMPRWRVSVLVLAIAAFVATSAGTVFWLYPSGQAAPPSAKIIPFTTFPGSADQPAFSPEGNQIAFAWDGGDSKNLDIYVKLIGAGDPLRLTFNAAQDISPAFSPDGRYLAFIRRTDDENGIFIVPALGGAERKIGSTEATFSRQGWSDCTLSWSPDGKFLAAADRLSNNERVGISLLSAEDGSKRRLTSPPEAAADTSPAFSPDGQTVAFIREININSQEIYLASVTGGEPRQLTSDAQRIQGLAWTPDGREIVYSSNHGAGFGLWRIAISGSQAERVSGTGQNAHSPEISRQGGRLVYRSSFVDSNIWSVDGPGVRGRESSATKLISSTRQDHSPQYSPDGKKVVFTSDRSGSEELWISESDGTDQVQLTSIDKNSVGSPRWSPDAKQIVFDARPDGNANIYVISADGGKPRPITSDPSHDVIASWSRDGRTIYFCSNRSGVYQIWKTPAEGGDSVQVTQHGGFESFESPNGELLYYTKGRGPDGIWQMPVAGGEETQVAALSDAAYWRYWSVQQDGIYFLAPSESEHPAIKFFGFANHRVQQLGSLQQNPVVGPPGLTVSPDGRSILYAQADQSISDLMLVENFR